MRNAGNGITRKDSTPELDGQMRYFSAAAVVLADVKKGKGTYGYNAATGEYGDMLDLGILDPTEVTRLAL